MDTTAQDQILGLYQQLLQQWNKRNATGMAALFAINGSLIGFDGSQLNGQKEIYDVMQEIFTDHPTANYVSIVKEVRMLGDDAALVMAVVGMVGKGQSQINPMVNAIQTMTAVKEDGKWRIALFQNTPAAFHGRPDLSDQLTEDLQAALRGSISQQ